MTEEEYLNQTTHYFSESAGEMVEIDSMPFPYALNAYNKLRREFGEAFDGTPLACVLLDRIMPPSDDLARSLRVHGHATTYVPRPDRVAAARSRMRRIGKSIGKDVRTHRNGDWVEGTCDPDPIPQVKVRAVQKTVRNRFARSR